MDDAQANVKNYYVSGELYDWVTDPRALEKVFHMRRAGIAKRVIGRLPTTLAIDVGCGTGLITASIRAKVLVGLDINRWNLNRAKARIRHADFVQCDAEHLPLRDSISDLTVCTEILEHLTHPKRALEEIARVLKTDARVVGSVPSNSPLWKLRNLLSVTHPQSEPFHNNFSRRSFKDLLSTAFGQYDVYFENFFMNIFFVAYAPKGKWNPLNTPQIGNEPACSRKTDC